MYRIYFIISYCDQKMDNYFTEYHTPFVRFLEIIVHIINLIQKANKIQPCSRIYYSDVS